MVSLPENPVFFIHNSLLFLYYLNVSLTAALSNWKLFRDSTVMGLFSGKVFTISSRIFSWTSGYFARQYKLNTRLGEVCKMKNIYSTRKNHSLEGTMWDNQAIFFSPNYAPYFVLSSNKITIYFPHFAIFGAFHRHGLPVRTHPNTRMASLLSSILSVLPSPQLTSDRRRRKSINFHFILLAPPLYTFPLIHTCI